ncbi:hypothetical protein, partial [Klebsiella pneumoniae]
RCDEGHVDRTETQKHYVCDNVLVSDLFENLLVKIRVTGNSNSQNNTALLLHLAKAIERNSTESCVVYRMSPNEKRVRNVDSYLF